MLASYNGIRYDALRYQSSKFGGGRGVAKIFRLVKKSCQPGVFVLLCMVLLCVVVFLGRSSVFDSGGRGGTNTNLWGNRDGYEKNRKSVAETDVPYEKMLNDAQGHQKIVQESGQQTRKLSLTELHPMPPENPLSKYPPVIGGYWASGYPHFDLDRQASDKTMKTGVQLVLFREDVANLKRYLLDMPEEMWTEKYLRRHNAWLTGREKSVLKDQVMLIYSDKKANNVVEFPLYYREFAPMIDPILQKALGDDMNNIARLYLSRMPPGTHIKRHKDLAAGLLHRLHLVVSSPSLASFHVCENLEVDSQECVPLSLDEGNLFEFNNGVFHYVDNNDAFPRIHMVIDVAKKRLPRQRLKKGQVCKFSREPSKIAC